MRHEDGGLFWIFSSVALQPASGLDLFIVEVSISHTHAHARTQMLGLFWTSDQPEAEDAAYTTNSGDEQPFPQRESNRRSQ